MSAIQTLKQEHSALDKNQLAVAIVKNIPFNDIVLCIDYAKGNVKSERVSFLHLAVDMGGEFQEVCYQFHNKSDLVPHLRQFLSEEACKQVVDSFNFTGTHFVNDFVFPHPVYGNQEVLVSVVI